jgi:hypothetical protein
MKNTILDQSKAKLENWYQRLINFNDFHMLFFNVKQYWTFINESNFIKDIIQELIVNNREMETNLEANLGSNKKEIPCDEEKLAALTYFLMKNSMTHDSYKLIKDVIRLIGKVPSPNESLKIFITSFLQTLNWYIIDKLTNNRIMLYLFERYKHKCEWFRRKEIFDVYINNTQMGEKILQKSIYMDLFDQGMNLIIEPSSASGEVDFITDQKGDERELIEVKIFNPEKQKNNKYITSGFNQLLSYTRDYNETCGYLVIFNTSDKELKFDFKNDSSIFPYIEFNNKIIYFIIIDIYPHEKTASKRGTLSSLVITEEEIIKEIKLEENIDKTNTKDCNPY